MTGDEVQVQHTYQVTFSIGEDYKDTIWCNVLPVDSGDILLGRPWMYDENGIHGISKSHSIQRNQNPQRKEQEKISQRKWFTYTMSIEAT